MRELFPQLIAGDRASGHNFYMDIIEDIAKKAGLDVILIIDGVRDLINKVLNWHYGYEADWTA